MLPYTGKTSETDIQTDSMCQSANVDTQHVPTLSTSSTFVPVKLQVSIRQDILTEVLRKKLQPDQTNEQTDSCYLLHPPNNWGIMGDTMLTFPAWNFIRELLQFSHKEAIQVMCMWIEPLAQFQTGMESELLKTGNKQQLLMQEMNLLFLAYPCVFITI